MWLEPCGNARLQRKQMAHTNENQRPPKCRLLGHMISASCPKADICDANEHTPYRAGKARERRI